MVLTVQDVSCPYRAGPTNACRQHPWDDQLIMKSWHIADLLLGRTTKPYCVLVLNQPINKRAFNAVIGRAAMLVCADAGANQLLKYHKQNASQPLPDAIVGDLDSLSQEAQQHYSKQGVQIIKDPDQYSTDFTKSLVWIRKEWQKQCVENAELDVVVMGGLGGRVDQGFSQIHHLYLALNQPDLLHGSMYLLSEQSLSFVLEAGENQLRVNDRVFAENIGIIPVLGKTFVSTSGLEWDVADWPTEFGAQVSTSNHIRSDFVSITIDGPRPLFTVELIKELCA